MPLKNFILVLFVAIVVSSCSTGKSAYKRGDYYDATMQAVQYLRLKPESDKALQTLKNSYPMAQNYYTQKVNELNITNSPDKYVGIVEIYTKLNQLADEISRCPAALEAVRPVVYYHDQLRTAKDLAAKEQYDQAMALMQTGSLDDARLAYVRLEKVKSCKPDYPDIDRLLIVSEDNATFKVVVEQVPVQSDAFQVSAKVFYDRMFGYLKRSVEKKFLRFYQPDDAEEFQIQPHQIIRMQFNDFMVGNLRDRESTEEFTSDSIVVGNYVDSQGVSHNVRNIVKAKVTTYQRELLSKGFLDLIILDFRSNEMQANRKFPGEFLWQNQWATFNGDSRALPVEKAKLVNQKQEIPPQPQELFLLFSEPIYNNASSYLGSYYRKR